MQALPTRLATVVATAALAGCMTPSHFEPVEHSGFLEDYSALTAVDRPSGVHEWRWAKDGLDATQFQAITLSPIQFHPEPKASDQVSLDALNRARTLIDQGLRELALSRQLPLTDQPEANGVTLETAITTVEVSLQDMKFRELIPKRMVISGAQLALGYRDQEVILLMEYRIRDNDSGEVLVRGVRKGETRPLDDDKEQLGEDHLKHLVDQLIEDLETDLPVPVSDRSRPATES